MLPNQPAASFGTSHYSTATLVLHYSSMLVIWLTATPSSESCCLKHALYCAYMYSTQGMYSFRWRYSLVIYICNFYKKAMWYVYKHVGYQLYKLHHLSTSPTLLLSFICANTYIHTNTCTHTRHSLIITTSTTKAHKYAVY